MPEPPSTDAELLAHDLASYRCPDGHYDELFGPMRQVRPAYRRLMGLEPVLSSPEAAARWRATKQSLQDNPPASTGQLIKSGIPHSWELDPIPVVLEPEAWRTLADGIRQRMHLIDLILADVHGKQALLRNGYLPPALVYGAPGYLRAARRTEGHRQRMLHLYAAQVARTASGQWIVIADRTQGPSGCGHAVENRLAMSRLLSDDFQSMRVERLAGFFSALRQSIQESLPTKEKNPRIALLSPGVQSQTYFEDAYLARYLGYSLTQTADLTVRGGVVYLKTLGGLVRIDGILRRLADIKCDPLELDPTGSDGVPGLTQASREDRVYMANAIGTGWGESPALLSLLPKLCQLLFGEPLKLESVPSWWCGDREGLEYVLEHFDQLIIRDAFVRHSAHQVIGRELHGTERERFMNSIRAQPWAFVAMRPVQYGYAPAWVHHRIVAWPTVFRFFACAHRDKIEVMPGGVARVADTADKLDESLVSGLMSKDVWVTSKDVVKPISLLTGGKQSVELKRSAMDLPSRVAEHLFWLGRFAERAEFMTRHARYCTSQLTSELSSDVLGAQWQVVRALAESTGLENEPVADSPEIAMHAMRSAVRDFLFDRSKPDGIAAAVLGILRNAENIRDRLSLDSFQIISRLDYSVLIPWANPRDRMGDTLLILNQIISLLSAFSGLASESMTRGPGWHFLDLGRRIERGQNLLRLIESLLVPVHRNYRQLLQSMLDICDSSMTYRYRYLMSYEIGPVLDLLVVDQSNPRGLAFQFMQIVSHLDAFNIGDKTELVRQRKRITDCRASLRLLDPDAIGDEVATDESGRMERKLLGVKVHDYLSDLSELSDFVSRRFLTHTTVRQLEDMVNQ
ncbi:MAG: circularly permuted type 2 ATP-grasp protein [Planctomycetota bacterium]